MKTFQVLGFERTMYDQDELRTSARKENPKITFSNTQFRKTWDRLDVNVRPGTAGTDIDIATATRNHPSLALGMSPRAALALQRASRAQALTVGRDFVIPDDLKALAGPVLEHRLMLTPEAQLTGTAPADVVSDVLSTVPVPTGRDGS